MSQTEPPVGTTLPGVPSARVEQPGGALPPQPSPPYARPALAAVDVGALRHPTENSRFAIALVAASAVVSGAVLVLLSLGRASQILLVLLAIGFAFLVLWFSLQLWRVRLLADGVQVSAASLPEVQEVMDVVRARLDYRRRVDVFVVDKVSRVLKPDAAPITLTTFFGVRVIVCEGGALGDLEDERQREQLVFLLATCVGALKARHTRWSPYLLALELSGLPKLVFLFIYPWYRATTYTGDRIAYACCGDLDVSLEAVYRVLVGKETAPHLRAAGLVQQALVVRRKFILRLSQLLRRVPHATNRYLDLLSFAASHDAAVFETFRTSLGEAPGEVDGVFARLRQRRPSTVAVPIGTLLAALLLLVGVVAGLKLPSSGLASSFDPTPTPEPFTFSPSPAASTSPSPDVLTQALTPAQTLLARLPADVRDTCTEGTPTQGSGIVAVLDCSGSAAAGPVTVAYWAYTTTEGMQADFDATTGGMPEARCSTGYGRGTWSRGGVERGPIACYTITAGESAVFWGDSELAILAYAHDPGLSVAEVFAWWKDHASFSN
jgi:hypothetical protein